MEKANIPAYLHYGSNAYIGDIIVLPDLGWLVTDDTDFNVGGAHGFDPTYDDMQVMFRACGPDFKKGYTASKFHNVSIYSLLAYLLGITPEKTDGSLEEVKGMLKALPAQSSTSEAVLISFDKFVKHDLYECNLYHSFCGFSKEFIIDGQPSEVFQP